MRYIDLKLFRWGFFLMLLTASVSAWSQQPEEEEIEELKPNAQGVYEKPELRFRNIESRVVGDTLYLAFQMQVAGSVVGYDEALHIVPMYRCDGLIYDFPKILIQDKTRNRYYQREIELQDKETYIAERPYAVVTLDGNRTLKNVLYQGSIRLPGGVCQEGSTLELSQILQDCCRYQELGTYDIPLGITQPAPQPTPQPVLPQQPNRPRFGINDLLFYRPEAEAIKMREEKAIVRIQFMVARHDILPAYKGNYLELEKVNRMLQPLLASRPGDIQIQKASIKGYASPEAGIEYNRALSQRRADSFKSYLLRQYRGLKDIAYFPALGMGEDWAGLREAVVKHPVVPRKTEVLAIIDYVDLYNGREKQLMDLAGGVPYRYLLENLFPPLRRMEMEVHYRVRGYQVHEVEAIYDTRPQDLSQAEIYEVAQRRNRANTPLNRYGKEYDVAAKYFPNDLVANLNASSAALIRGEVELAGSYLQRIATHPEAATNLGLYHWLRGDLEQAKTYLEKALSDPQQAPHARAFLRQLKQ